jgi:hypothetical protein
MDAVDKGQPWVDHWPMWDEGLSKFPAPFDIATARGNWRESSTRDCGQGRNCRRHRLNWRSFGSEILFRVGIDSRRHRTLQTEGKA